MICYINGKIADVKNGEYLPETQIWVEDGKILKLAAADTKLPAGAQWVDLGGRTVLPGLFNVHTHIQFDSTPKGAVIYASEPRFTVSAIKNLKKYLNSGVTFIRDMAGAKYVDLEMRDMLREGLIEGPTMLAGGKNLSATGGQSWENGVEVDGVDACIRAVRQQCKMDVDWIKLMAGGGSKNPRTSPEAPQLSLQEMQAVVEEAARWEREVAAHTMGGLSSKYAAMAGVRSIEHGWNLDDQTLDIMAEKGICYVPTLAVSYCIVKNAGKPGITKDMVESTKQKQELQRRSIAKAMERGILICAGNDACGPYNDHDGTANELAAMVELGMSHADAIRAATINSAKLCRVQHCRGSIEAGKIADLAVFEGDPYEDIAAIWNCVAVVQAGNLVKNEL